MSPAAGPATDRFSLAGRVALVTGSGGALGQALATAMMGAGAAVALHDRSAEQLRESQRLLDAIGGRHASFVADLASVDDCRRLVHEVHGAFGRIDILVNNAGVTKREPIDDVTPETFDWIIAVDVRAPYFLSQTAHPIMKAQGGGKIINVSSMTHLYALDTISVYGLAKGAVAQMTREMGVEFAPDNIQVNCLTPGILKTPMNAEALWGVEQMRAWILNRVPLRRPGLPEDMVGAVLFMASSASDWMTGQDVVVDGGMTAGGSWVYQGPTTE